MDKEQARKLYELADRLSKLDVNTLSEEQLAERSTMIARLQEVKQRLDPKCWDGYKKQGTKIKGGVRVNNCVPESAEQGVTEAAEDRTSYQIAKILYDKGIRYDSSSKEGQLITAIGDVMVNELGMDKRIVRNIISRDDDFLADTLDELYHMSQNVQEANGEYDDEAGMAESNLHTMARAVNGLLDTIEDNDNLPEWAQEKIAKAEMMITSVWDYLLSQKEQGMDPKVTEGSQRVDSLVTDALRIMKGAEVSDAVSALKTVLGDREYNGRRGFYSFYVKQILDMYNQQGVTEAKKPSPKLTAVNIKKTDPVSEEINKEAYERLQKVFAFKNYES